MLCTSLVYKTRKPRTKRHATRYTHLAVGGDDSEALYRARKRTRTTMSDIAVQVAHNVAKSARRDTLHALEGGNERGGKKQKLAVTAVAVFFFKSR